MGLRSLGLGLLLWGSMRFLLRLRASTRNLRTPVFKAGGGGGWGFGAFGLGGYGPGIENNTSSATS